MGACNATAVGRETLEGGFQATCTYKSWFPGAALWCEVGCCVAVESAAAHESWWGASWQGGQVRPSSHQRHNATPPHFTLSARTRRLVLILVDCVPCLYSSLMHHNRTTIKRTQHRPSQCCTQKPYPMKPEQKLQARANPMSLCAKTPHQLSKTDHRKFYFFLPLALPLPAEPVEVTLLARDVAGEALPLTVSSCLFYVLCQ